MLHIVVTTVEKEHDARALAQAAVLQSYAACVHIESIGSVYRWEGELQSSTEYRLSFKTTSTASARLRHWLQAHHPYQLPAIYTVQVQDVDPRFLSWVTEASRDSADSP